MYINNNYYFLNAETWVTKCFVIKEFISWVHLQKIIGRDNNFKWNLGCLELNVDEIL